MRDQRQQEIKEREESFARTLEETREDLQEKADTNLMKLHHKYMENVLVSTG